MSTAHRRFFARPVALAMSILAFAFALEGCESFPELALEPPSVEIPKPQSTIDERIAHYAALYEVPEALIRRSIRRESGYNPLARNGPYWGLMQIRVDTARGMGFRGAPRDLLNADTNLKYAARYLANAYVVAGRNPDRTIALYAHGYYYVARSRGVLDQLKVAQE